MEWVLKRSIQGFLEIATRAISDARAILPEGHPLEDDLFNLEVDVREIIEKFK